MFKIIYNPECSKSREVIKILEHHHIKFKKIHYLDGELSVDLLDEVLAVLKLDPSDIIRRKEDQISYLSLDFDNHLMIKEAILSYPQILERPIIWSKNKGVIARPPEKVFDLFD